MLKVRLSVKHRAGETWLEGKGTGSYVWPPEFDSQEPQNSKEPSP